MLGLFGAAVNALGIAIAAGMKSFEGFGGVVNFLIQPIFFLSGALYPVDRIPAPLKLSCGPTRCATPSTWSGA